MTAPIALGLAALGVLAVPAVVLWLQRRGQVRRLMRQQRGDRLEALRHRDK
jgi:uncharacterized iron-regulated membrane protein